MYFIVLFALAEHPRMHRIGLDKSFRILDCPNYISLQIPLRMFSIGDFGSCAIKKPFH